MIALLPLRRGGSVTWPGSQATGAAHSPELTDTGDAYIAEVELPGLSADDVSVEVAGQELVITGRLASATGAGRGAALTAARAGAFECRVLLPGPAEPATVTAWLAGGVLTVTAPKAVSG